MTAGVQFVIRNFALDPDCAEFCFQRSANLSGQLADRENLRRLLEKISGQLHGVARASGLRTNLNRKLQACAIIIPLARWLAV